MSVKKTRKQIAREKEKLAVITDGCNPELVEGAEFDGLFEIPIIKKPQKIMIPKGMVPFSKMERVEPEKFAAQVVNKYRSHAIGYYMQKRGIYVIPNVRWGDERTYTTKFFPEKLAFLGVEKHSIVSIGSYGVVKTKEEKKHFRVGLESMLETLEPETVLVYGAMPEDIFDDYRNCTEFIKYPDWTTYIRSEKNG